MAEVTSSCKDRRRGGVFGPVMPFATWFTKYGAWGSHLPCQTSEFLPSAHISPPKTTSHHNCVHYVLNEEVMLFATSAKRDKAIKCKKSDRKCA